MVNAAAAYQSTFQVTTASKGFVNQATQTQFAKATDQELTQKKTLTTLDDADKGIDQSKASSRKSAQGEGRGQFVDILA